MLVIALSLGGLFVISMALLVSFRPEPEYQGRPLSAWLAQLNYSHSPQDTVASNAIHQMGTEILPYLGPMLRARDSSLKSRLMAALSKQRLIKIPFVSADTQQQRASRACRVLGAAAVEYLPQLTAMLESTNHVTAWCGSAAILDVKARSNCVPELTKALTNGWAQLRWHAASVLGSLEGKAHAAIPQLNRALKDSDAQVRKNALYALYRINPGSSEFLQGALQHLKDPDDQVRGHAAQLLARTGDARDPKPLPRLQQSSRL